MRDRCEKDVQAVIRRYSDLCRSYHAVLEGKTSAGEWIAAARQVLLQADRAIRGLRELIYRPRLSDERVVAYQWRSQLALVQRDLADMTQYLQVTSGGR